MMQVIYILSCCWISPDPDAVFICYLKMTWCYLQRHCLLPDMRHQLSGKTWGWNISSTEYPVPHKDVTFIVPLSPLALFFCFSCHQGQDNQIFCFAYNMGCAVTFIEVLRRHPNSLKNIFKRLLISLFYLLLHPYFSHARECAGTFWKVLVTSLRTTSSITTDTLTHQQNARWEKRKQDWVCFQFLYHQLPWVQKKVNCTFCRIFAARTLSAISSPISAPSVTFLLSVATQSSTKISS